MAEHLARIIGTEEDRVNCPFYWKIGACRHGDQCSRSHYKPSASQTLILRHMYQNPPVGVAIAEGQKVSDELLDEAADHFEAFFSEVFEELSNYGEIEDMVVCDNIGDHIIGNVYVKYADAEAAANAIKNLSGRFYAGKQIQVEYTPVTDFREARCRQFVDGQCRRGGYCNFMHMKHIPSSLKRKLFRKMYEDHPELRRKVPRSRSREGDKGDSSNNHNSYRDKGRDRGGRDREGDRSYDDRSRGRVREREIRRPPRERGGRSKSASSTEGAPPRRRTSEERRAMIAQWNDERDRREQEQVQGSSAAPLGDIPSA
ncbi:putative U2 snRNP auxiliary factor [Cardiosporidium cionae]|uniref:U2 snRNP auxiliary factor n=1 Tax=Cardiosporidium cionae TaxID=476202 RepID=A0ABQ7JCP9_9APIC|nr:putative U2 snRNP auxiliary factor [Cardiosporidium cionae]|eukprot:KAF8821734.1 putative U2 snRNP auxiliary factor [Cardiosporidium cionae]